MLLLILIPTIWLAILIGCLSICVMAARGDAMANPALDSAPLPKHRLPSTAVSPTLRLIDGRIARRGPLTGRAAQ